ncbi:Bud-site selection protein [Usnea florida]
MPERKHEENSSSGIASNNTEARALRLQQLQLSGLLDQSKTHLFRSLKVARGFERQKLGRRQKTAKAGSNSADTKTRLDAEVAALKGLDLAATAEIHLYKSLLKTKSIASAPALPHHVRATVDALKKPQESASSNVQARLFKSAPVQAAMKEALKSIRAVLGVEELRPNGKGRLRAKDYANGVRNTDVDELAVSERDISPVRNTLARDEDCSGFSTQESPRNTQSKGLFDHDDGDHDDDHDDDGEDMDYDIYATRLAGSSDEESNGLDVNGQDHDRDKLHDMEITEDEADEEDHHDNEGARNPTNSNTKSPTPPPKRPPQPSKSKPPSAPPKSTTFLPSLSLGGYWSGSDSDLPSDDDDDDSAAPKSQIRKNRMGQQARRALWEKKFGTNANHVRKQQARDRDQGWDARRGAKGVDERGKRGRGRGRGGGARGMVAAGRGGSRGGGVRFAKSTGANSDPVVARKAKTSAAATPAAAGPLHPSWEAARKAKEQKKAVPFQGKKVVFD